MSLTLFGPLLISLPRRLFPFHQHRSFSLFLLLPLQNSDVEHIVFAAKKNIFPGYYGAISWPPPPEERMAVLCQARDGGKEEEKEGRRRG